MISWPSVDDDGERYGCWTIAWRAGSTRGG